MIDLNQLPSTCLEKTSSEERKQVTALIGQLAQLDGFAASLATKLLRKKRPDLVPILDNQAIFGAYMNTRWPEIPAPGDSTRDKNRIQTALDWIAFDITRPQNEEAWEELHDIEPTRTRIQLFDSVWWLYFRQIQPVIRSKRGQE